MRRERRAEDGGLIARVVVGHHGGQYIGNMARKTPRQAPRAAGSRRAGARKPLGQMAAADVKAAQGELPQWSTAEVEEAFRRFHAADPDPETELEHGNVFTLLVAVVLS